MSRRAEVPPTQTANAEIDERSRSLSKFDELIDRRDASLRQQAQAHVEAYTSVRAYAESIKVVEQDLQKLCSRSLKDLKRAAPLDGENLESDVSVLNANVSQDKTIMDNHRPEHIGSKIEDDSSEGNASSDHDERGSPTPSFPPLARVRNVAFSHTIREQDGTSVPPSTSRESQGYGIQFGPPPKRLKTEASSISASENLEHATGASMFQSAAAQMERV